MFIGGFFAGVVTTVLIGKGLNKLQNNKQIELLQNEGQLARDQLIKKSGPVIDHMVIRTRDTKSLQRSLDFWAQNFQYELEREDEATAFIQDPENAKVAFPSVRINNSSVIDIFPIEMKPYYCKSTPVNHVVDHLCLNLPGEQMVKVLENFATNHVSVVKVAGDFAKDDNAGTNTFFGPWGARGRGISVYLYEPSGLYLEIRTYDLEYVPEIREKGLRLLESKDRNVEETF